MSLPQVASTINLVLDEGEKNASIVHIKSSESSDSSSDLDLSQSKNRVKKHSKWLGLFFTVLSGFLFASVGILVKHMKGYHVLNLGLFRFLGIFLPALPCTLMEIWKHKAKGNTIFEPLWPLSEPAKLRTMIVLFGRALFGFGAIISQFIAIQYIPVADAVVISSCSSVFVGFAAHLFLREKCGVFPFLTAIMTVTGVAIMSRPPMLTGSKEYDWDTMIGTGFALSRMVLTSFKIVFVRYLRDMNASLVVMTTGFLQLMQCFVISLALGVFEIPTKLSDLGLLVLLGLIGFSSQMSLTWALKCEKAGPFAVVRTSSDTLFAFLLQFLIFSVIPDMYSGIGAAIITTAVLLTVFKKWISSLPEDDKVRGIFTSAFLC